MSAAEIIAVAWPYAAAALLALAVFIAVVRRAANQGLKQPLSAEPIAKGSNSNTLIVVVHGHQRTLRLMEGLRRVIQAARPDADLLLLRYPAHGPSNADPAVIADQMCERLRSIYEQKAYADIFLVGYSKGALLLRKAYIYGCGRIDDLPGKSTRAERREPANWVKAVSRIVLLAGMNRGWSLRTRPAAMSWSCWVLYRAAERFGRLTGTGALVLRTRRGEPFVANLRLQWLDEMRARTAADRPTVIQLLGDRDDIVSTEDHRDVTVARDFVWVKVNNTGHADIIDMDDPSSGPERSRKVAMALGDAADVDALRRVSASLPSNEDPHVETVVFVLHGIRDMAAWTSQFELPLQNAFQPARPSGKLVVQRPSYDYFGMGPFLLWVDRQANVRWFMDEFTEIKARYPNLRHVHFIGHSNGTYVLASALQKYATLKVDRIAFAGSVVRRDYAWDSVADRIESVRNYVGCSDWVVGWFPKLFEMSPFGFVNRDIGSAGYNGFTQALGNAKETRYVEGAHDAALNPKNIDSIVAYIIGGKVTDTATLIARHPGLLDFSSRFCWVIWLLLLALVIGAGKLWLLAFTPLLASLPMPQLAGLWALASYGLVLFIVLKNG